MGKLNKNSKHPHLFLQLFFVLDTTCFFSVCIFNLFLQTTRAAFTRFKPISENCHDLLNVFSLNVSSNSVINLQLTVLLIQFPVDEFWKYFSLK